MVSIERGVEINLLSRLRILHLQDTIKDMKKSYYINFVLGFLVSTQMLFAQDQFERRYPVIQTNVETASLTAAGNGYASLGVEIDTEGDRDNVIVTFFDKKGTISTSISVSYGDTVKVIDAGEIVRLADGNFAFSAVLNKDSLNKVITYISSQGNVAWTTLLGQVTDEKELASEPSVLLDVPTNHIFHAHTVGAENNTTDIQLTSLNYLGEIEFDRTISLQTPAANSLNERFIEMKVGIDSTLMILGSTDDDQAPLFLTKMDTTGNIIWTKSLNANFGRDLDTKGADLVQLLDSTWVVIGSVLPTLSDRNGAVIIKVNDDGELLRTETLSSNSTRYQLYPNNVVGTLDTTVIISFIREDMISQTFQPLVITYNLDSVIGYQSQLDTSMTSDPKFVDLVTLDSLSATILYTTSKDDFIIPNLTKVDEDGRTQCEEFVTAVSIDSVDFTTGDLTATSTDNNSFLDSIDIIFGQFGRFSPPILSLNDTLFCPEDPIIYLVDATVRGGTEYMWDDGNSDSIRIFQEAGMFSVTVTVREDICFTLCDTVTISQLEFPMVSIGKNLNLLCTEDSIRLVTEISGASVDSYLWSNGSTAESITVGIDPMTYSVTVTDGCGNEANASTSVTEADLIPPVVASIERDCQLLTVVGSGFIEQEWSTGSTDPSITINDPGTYSVVLRDQCGREQAPISIEVDEDDFPAPITASILLECGDPRVLSVNGSGFTSQVWSTGETSESIELPSSGTYSVTLTGDAISGQGANCQNTMILTEDVSEAEFLNSTGCLIWPNAFQPVGGNMEDQMFGPNILTGCENLVSFEMKIFNRWGKNIFTSNSANVKWNGAIDGDPQPGGIYFYWAQYDDGNTTCERRGDIMLIR